MRLINVSRTILRFFRFVLFMLIIKWLIVRKLRRIVKVIKLTVKIMIFCATVFCFRFEKAFTLTRDSSRERCCKATAISKLEARSAAREFGELPAEMHLSSRKHHEHSPRDIRVVGEVESRDRVRCTWERRTNIRSKNENCNIYIKNTKLLPLITIERAFWRNLHSISPKVSIKPAPVISHHTAFSTAIDDASTDKTFQSKRPWMRWTAAVTGS